MNRCKAGDVSRRERSFVSGTLVLAATLGLHLASSAKAPSITGRAVDGGGVPVPGVSVTATPEAGGTLRHATSAADGTYQFASLPDGIYRIDFEILGFDMTRRNHVRVHKNVPASVDATLVVSAICDCVSVIDAVDLRERSGQVVNTSGRALAHARLEIVTPLHHEVRYADGAGRFQVRLPIAESWPLVASDSGFGTVTVHVSAAADGPIVLRLPHVGTTGVPDTERLRAPCCPSALFTREGR
jgi:hypothetical protein